MNESVTLANVGINNLTWAEVFDFIEQRVRQRSPCFLVTPNVDVIVKYNQNPSFARVYDQASLKLADGTPLLWAARFLGTPLKAKISGSDLVPALCQVAAQKGLSLFFLGGKPGSAQGAQERMTARYPGLRILGTHCPPFNFENKDVENVFIIQELKRLKPDVLIVGLGTPKQEFWISKFMAHYDVPVSIGVGGTFEFLSGAVRRAPRWMQVAGLEWFWRLLQEPGRLWKRYLVEDVVFFKLIWQQKKRMAS